MMNILIKICELINLINSEKEFVNYILVNLKKILQCKLKELVIVVFVFVVIIYCLINKLGLNGIGELKIEIVLSFCEINEEKDLNYDYFILEFDIFY